MRVNLKAKRMLSKLLCLAMVLGLVPTLALPALAAEEQAGTDDAYTFSLGAINVTENPNDAIKYEGGTITIQTADSTVTGKVELKLTYTIGTDTDPQPVTDNAYTLTVSSFTFDPELPNNASPVKGVVGPDDNGIITVELSVPTAFTDRDFDVKAKILKNGDPTDIEVFVGKIEVKAYYPTPINLTGNGDAVGAVTEGKFTVDSDKACVVLYAKTKQTVTKDDAASNTAKDWKKLDATASNGSYTFDLTNDPTNDLTNNKCAMTVVVALKGDVNFDGKIDSDDISKLVTVAAKDGFKFDSQIIQLIANVKGTEDKIDSDDISALVTAAATDLKALTEWDLETAN